ncbi:MAG: hypothetical protein IPK32_03085 [Verrucomicrobiaceae bacterium]|nr:hypothetical protein [Verrucomicrobiaceae bacterium]
MPPSAASTSSQPVPANVLEMARQAVRDFHECFWWWNPEFVPKSSEDVREIVLNLRKGGHGAWRRAQEINACL